MTDNARGKSDCCDSPQKSREYFKADNHAWEFEICDNCRSVERTGKVSMETEWHRKLATEELDCFIEDTREVMDLDPSERCECPDGASIDIFSREVLSRSYHLAVCYGCFNVLYSEVS